MGARLVKYVNRRYPTIRVGTLAYFRQFEGNQADPLDGAVEGLEFRGPSAPMHSSTFNKVMRGSNLNIVARDGLKLGATGSIRDRVYRTFRNAFVFCCSIERGKIPNLERAQHFNAADYWLVNNPPSLVSTVQQYLLENARDPNGQLLRHSNRYCRAWHAPVNYVQRSPAPVNERIDDLELFVFRKDPRFSLEQEYRFAWAFFDSTNDAQVPVQLEPIDIPLSHFSTME